MCNCTQHWGLISASAMYVLITDKWNQIYYGLRLYSRRSSLIEFKNRNELELYRNFKLAFIGIEEYIIFCNIIIILSCFFVGREYIFLLEFYCHQQWNWEYEPKLVCPLTSPLLSFCQAFFWLPFTFRYCLFNWH